MIRGLREFLENEIEPLDYIISIIPGRIKPKKGISLGFSVKVQYETSTGVKLLAARLRNSTGNFCRDQR